MQLIDARNMLIQEMRNNGLLEQGWRYDFNNRKAALGACNYTKSTIELSAPLVRVNDEARIRNTILHEIAHALTRGHGHDHVWRSKFISLGGNGQRCSSVSDGVRTAPPLWIGECPSCARQYGANRLTEKGRKNNGCRKGHAWNPLRWRKNVRQISLDTDQKVG